MAVAEPGLVAPDPVPMVADEPADGFLPHAERRGHAHGPVRGPDQEAEGADRLADELHGEVVHLEVNGSGGEGGIRTHVTGLP